MGGGAYLPDSGPGSKSLIAGNTTLGYFGLVSPADMFGQYDMSVATPLVAGTPSPPTNPNFGWWKFVYNGKYLFIPNDAVRNTVSWNDAYAAGLIYGVNGNGTYPGTPAVNQLVTVDVNDTADASYRFLVRSIKGAPVDPFNTANTSKPSEYDDLYPLVPGLVTTLAKLQEARLNTVDFTMNTSSSVSTSMIQRSLSVGGTTVAAGTKSSALQWRPVLELMPGEHAFSPRSVYYEYLGNQGPASITGTFINVVYNPTQFMVDDGGAAELLNLTAVSFVDVAQLPSFPVVSNTITPVSMTFART